MGKSGILLFSVLIVLSVLWKPAYTDDKCSVGCKGTPSGATFLNGHKYNYAVEGEVSIYLTGADKQETSVKLLGQASVSALGNCAYVLKVQNLAISGPDGKKYGKPAGLEKPVRFILQDGHVGSEICAEEGDTRRSLNIKRAVISLLQSGVKSGTEIDVFGACPTDASSSQEGAAVLVHRSRDLSRCGHREHGKNDLITAVYNPYAEIKNTQILKSQLNIESKVNNGIPEKVSATEEHLYKPFSVGENGARAKVHTKLTLTGKDAGGDNGKFTVVKPIIFENPHGGKLEASNLESAATAVKETATTLATEASSKSAGHFAQLVRIFRYTNKDDLLKLYAQVKGKNLERRVFLDGLLRAGTGASIEASVQLLKTKELSPLEQKLVFLSLGNARHVNDEAIKAAASLLDIPNIPKEVYLGVGALASAYCRAHNCHAGQSEGIKELSNKLSSKLNCKAKEKVKEDYVVAVLKGIRNIRHLEDSIIEKVVHCATDNSVKARVRVAALEAFRADPCSAKVKKAALDLLKNRQQDSEIRIKAYLAVIDCPCGKTANEIKTLLGTEPVHQVGRFITSSLRHIRASTNPDKRTQRQHYGLISTPNKFHVDDRKYSFYREASYSVDALGIGGNVEETVIYSQDSFLPRSVSLNLTAEVFGHSLNVLEVGGRQGNLDRVVEHFLGPKSFLRTENHQKLYDELVKRVMATQEKVEKKLTRGRRSVKTDIDNFDKHVKAESAPFDNELDMDIYVKLFGTDAVFLSLGDDKGINFDQVLDEILKYVDTGINQAKHFQQEIRSHMLFLDAELAYATSTGLPLKLNLVGSATARLEVATACDIRQIFRDFGKNAKVDVKFVPSTNIEISGLFYVDGDAVATGLKVVNNLHSSTGAHVVVKLIENGQGFDLQLGLPVDKQEIVTASHDLVYFTREKGQEEKHVALKVDVDRKEYSGCFDQLSNTLGLTLCGEVSVPFSVSGPEAQASLQKFLSRYPLTGSTKLKLLLEKNDLKGYHIKGLFRGDNAKRSFELLFDAQGSKNRKTAISGELVNSPEERSVFLNLESPIKNAQGRVALITSKSEYAAIVKAKLDADEYYGKVGFNVQGNDQRSVFKPVLEYQLPGPDGKKTLKVDGQIVKQFSGQTQKYTLEGIKISLPKDEVIDIQGGINFEPVGFDADIKAKKGDQNFLFAVVAKNNDGKIEFQNTLNPAVNFKLVAHIDNSKGNYRNDFDLYYSGDLKSPNNRVSFNQLLKYHQNPENLQDFGLITKNKLHVYALPLLAKVDAEADPKKLNLEVEGKYVDQKADMVIDARTHLKQAGDYQVNFHANLNDKGVEGTAKRVILSADKSNFENHFSVKNVASYDLSGVVLHKLKPNDINVGAIGQLKLSSSGKNEEIKFDVGAVENANLYSAHAKISHGAVAYIDALIKLNRGANANGQLKFVLKDAVVANGNFKVTDADGKGNGAIIVDFKNAGRKIKGDVKFVAMKAVFNADAELFLNFEKDNADKIVVSTNNKRTDELIESKNKLSYGGKNFEVNVHTSYKPQKVNQNVEVVLPNERCLTLKLDLVGGEDKDNNLDRSIELLLSDAEKRGGAASTFSYKGKVANTNYDKNTINYDGQVLLKLKDGKTLENVFSFKNNPAGDKFKGEFKSDVKGTLLPHPASLLATAEYSDPDESIFTNAETYRVKGTYGSDYAFELTGKDEYDLLKAGEKKYQEENTLTVHLPFESAHDIKLVSNVLYVLPENQDVYFEYSITESVQVNADVYKIDASGKFGPKVGNSKVKVAVPHVDPFSLDASYKAALEGDKKTCNVDVKATYGKGKSTSVNVAATAAPHESSLTVKANSPQAEKLKKLEVTVHTKKPSSDGYSSSVIVDADGRVYKSDLNLVYSKAHPLMDLSYSSPSQPKPSRVFVKGNAVSSTQGKIDVKIENIKDFSLDANYESQVQKNDIYWKLHANSEKLNMKNYKVDISSKDAANGKRLEFNAVNDGKNVFSGSTSYISKQEGPKTIIEGSGSVKVKEEQKSATFKYIRTLLTEGSEQGVETFMNVAIGERSYVAESRITNLEYKTSYVLCEEKKQCAHAELHSKLNVQKPGELEHTLNVALDLRKLGFSPELGLQASASISEHRLPQYTMDLHVSKEDHKYHMHVYSTPEHGKFPAGITINLPKRILALESLIQYPTNKNLPFPIKGEATLYMDKNKPQQKAALRALIDLSGADKATNAVAEFGFSHPKMGKEAVLKFRGSLKRPTDNSLKIESAATLSCPVLGGDREAKVLFEASPSHIKVYVDNPLVKVIDLEGSISNADQTQQANLKFSLLQGKPVQVKALVKEFKYFEFTTGYSGKEDADRKLSVTAHIDPEKRVDISADIVLPNEKKNIAHGALFLQDNLVKSDYGVSKPNFNYFVNALKSDMATLKQRVEQLADKAGNELKTTLSKVEPSLKDLNTYYTNELKKLLSEVSDDKVLKEISEAIHIITKYVAQIVEEILNVTNPIVEQILKVYTETSKKVLELYKSKIEPQLKQLYGSISQIIHEGTDGLIDLVAHFAAIAQDFFEKHKPEFQELTNTLTEIFKDLTRIIVAQLKEFRANFDQVLKDLVQQIKDMPVVAMIQEKMKDLAVPDQVLAMFSEAHQAVRVVLPTEETKVLSDAIAGYIQKKLRQQKVNDSEELRVIYEKFTLALTSLVQFIRQQLNHLGVPSVLGFNTLPYFSGSQPSLPVFGPPAFSVLNMIIHGDFVSPLQLVRDYRIRSLNPLDEVPAKLRAVVVNGQHIFTFDGRHLTFPGTCRYVLVHDHVDRNFTLAIQLQAGAIKGLLLEDKSGSTIELKPNGQVLVNEAAHGFPVTENDIFAFREPNGHIGMGSRYGLLIRGSPDLSAFYVEVSGFYLGKLRGLLGDGNNEPYDDFRLPNGKIVTSESEFGHAYRLSSSCAPVKGPEHSHHQHHSALPPACEQVFGGSSPLRAASLLLDVAPFRQACIHAVASNPTKALQEACALGTGYTALAVTGLLPAVLPPACLQCTDADQPKNIGDSYPVKMPSKQADVVVTVETVKGNEKTYKELVVPLVGKIVDSLKSKHFDDIKVYLVGITPKMPYPLVYDTDNKLKDAKIVFDDETRNAKPCNLINTGNEKVDALKNKLAEMVAAVQNGLGLTNVESSYASLSELPLRAGAVKHILNVIDEPCTSHLPGVDMLKVLHYQAFFKNLGVTVSSISGVPIEIGEGKKPADVVGYSKDSVLLVGDKTKGKDSQALRATLHASHGSEDYCHNVVREMDGVIFPSKSFFANAEAQKQYIQQAAANIVERMTSVKIELECVCVYRNPFQAKSLCVSDSIMVSRK